MSIDIERVMLTVAESARYAIENIKAGTPNSAMDNLIGLETMAHMLAEGAVPKRTWRRIVMNHEWHDDFAEERIYAKVNWITEHHPDGMIESIVCRPLGDSRCLRRAYTFIVKVPA